MKGVTYVHKLLTKNLKEIPEMEIDPPERGSWVYCIRGKNCVLYCTTVYIKPKMSAVSLGDLGETCSPRDPAEVNLFYQDV